ncbi:hypothetical protein BJ944DRAFT_67087 [Cunninghamella echinulata]|nr:hypothetical protein BJ944DRAFT_67087 [Cunninghamella echinulata]
MFLKALLSGHSKKDNENSPNNSQHSRPITSISSDSNARTGRDSGSTYIHSNPTLLRSEALDISTTTITNPTAQKINDTSKQLGNNTISSTHRHNVLKAGKNKLTSFKQTKDINSTIESNPILISNINNDSNNATTELTANNSATLTNNHISSSTPTLKNTINKVVVSSNYTPFKQNSIIEIPNQIISTSISSKTSALTPEIKLASVRSSNNTRSHENVNSVTECRSKQASLNKVTRDINTRLYFNTRDNTETSARNINTRLSYESPNKLNNIERDDENSKRLFIGKLNMNVTKELLYERFKRYGPITEVYKKPCNSFGFVQYLKPKYAERAIRYEDDRYRWGVHIEVQKCQRKRTYAPTKSTSDCIVIPESKYYDYVDNDDVKAKDDKDTKNSSEPSSRNQNDKEQSRKSTRHNGRDYYKDRYSPNEHSHGEHYSQYDDCYYSTKRSRSRDRSDSHEVHRSKSRCDSRESHSRKIREQHRSKENNDSEYHQKTTNHSSSSSPLHGLKGKDNISPKNNQSTTLINKKPTTIKQTLKCGLKRLADIDTIDNRTSKASKTRSFEENDKIKLGSDIIKVESLTDNAVKEFIKSDDSNYLKNYHGLNNNSDQSLNQCKQHSIKGYVNNVNYLVTSQDSSLKHTGLAATPSSTSKASDILNVIQENNKSILQKHGNDPRLRNRNTILKNDNSSPAQPYFTIPNIKHHNAGSRLANSPSLAEPSSVQLQQNNSTTCSLPSNVNCDPRYVMKLTQNNMNKANNIGIISPIIPASINPIQNINTEPVTIMDDNTSATLTPSKISESYVVQLVCVGNLNQKLYIDIENQLSFIPKIKCRAFFYPFTNTSREEVLKQVPIMDTNAVLYIDESYQSNNKLFLQIFNSQITKRVHFDEYEQISISDAILIIQQSIEIEQSNILNMQIIHMPNNQPNLSWSSMELAPNSLPVSSSSTQSTMVSSDHSDTDTNLQAIQYIISNLKQVQDYSTKNTINTLTSYNALASNSNNINLVSQALLRLNMNPHLSPTVRHQVIQELLTCLLSSHTKQEYSFQQPSQPSYENILAPLISSLGSNQSISSEQQNAVQSLMNSFTVDSSKNI